MGRFYVADVSADEYMEAIRGTGKYGNFMGIILHEMRKGYVEGLLRVGKYFDIAIKATREQAITELEGNFERSRKGNAGNFE